MIKKTLTIILVIFLSSCESSKDALIKKRLKSTWSKHFSKTYDKTSQIDIFVVTNRVKKSAEFSCDKGAFGTEKAIGVSYGICRVNVPKNHDVGEIPELIVSEGYLYQNFKILSEKSLDEDSLLQKIKESKRNPLVFVHGFNVGYQESLLRASQIAYDLKYQGPIILFTWPAGEEKNRATISRIVDNAYLKDKKNVNLSIGDFSKFLLKLNKYAITPNIIVHSMGHELVLNSINLINYNDLKSDLVDNLIMNAPDFELSKFSKILPTLVSKTNKMILYCAGNDSAIKVSNKINNSARLGHCFNSKEINWSSDKHALEVIDVSIINDSILGHDYYVSKEVLNDVYQAFFGINVEERIFIAKKDFENKQYYLRK